MSNTGAREESSWALSSRAAVGGRKIKYEVVHCKGEGSLGKGRDLSKVLDEPWELLLLGTESFKPNFWLEQRVGMKSLGMR